MISFWGQVADGLRVESAFWHVLAMGSCTAARGDVVTLGSKLLNEHFACCHQVHESMSALSHFHHKETLVITNIEPSQPVCQRWQVPCSDLGVTREENTAQLTLVPSPRCTSCVPPLPSHRLHYTEAGWSGTGTQSQSTTSHHSILIG